MKASGMPIFFKLESDEDAMDVNEDESEDEWTEEEDNGNNEWE